MRSVALRLRAVLAALAVAGGLAVSAPRPAPGPAPFVPLKVGQFLVATRQVGGPVFAQSVILLLEYDAEGALGLIVNRPLEVSVASVLPELEEASSRDDRLHLGGPVQRDRMLVLLRAGEPPAGSERVFADVHRSGSIVTLRQALADGVPGSRLRVYAGYAGWGARQLDGEVTRGDWLVLPGDADTVFAATSEGIWPRLLRDASGRWVRLGYPQLEPSA